MISKNYYKQRILRQVFGHRFVDSLIYMKNHLVYGKRLIWPDMKSGKRFTERMLYLKHYVTPEDYDKYVDKLLVRDFIKETIGETYLIPLIGSWKSRNEVIIDEIPIDSVLKTNHISGDVFLVNTKSEIVTALEKLFPLLEYNYYLYGGEKQYKNIQPHVICEKRIGPPEGIKDYKIFCFQGSPSYVQVDYDRFTNHKRCFYDTEWNYLGFSTIYPLAKNGDEPPETLQEMLYISRILSRDFEFVRVDLYEVDGRIYFGELTFHHGGGFEPFIPGSFDFILGAKLVSGT